MAGKMNQAQVQELVEKITQTTAKSPDMKDIGDLIGQVNSHKNASAVVEGILSQLRLPKMRTVFFALGALDMCMAKCDASFHKQVATQDFMKQLTTMLLNQNMAKEIKTRITQLIQSWAIRFKDKQDTLPLFFQLYDALKKRGVEFGPVQQQSGQGESKPQAPARGDSNKSDKKDAGHPEVAPKYQKLMQDMNQVKGNINFTNEVVDQSEPGDVNETLTDMYRALKKVEPKVQGVITQVDDEALVNACIIINDDIQKTFERIKALKKGYKPLVFQPGESTQKSVLNPTHIYSKQAPEPKKEAAAPAKAKPAEPMGDLLNLGGPAQQMPAQQQPMMMNPAMAGGNPMMGGMGMNPMMAGNPMMMQQPQPQAPPKPAPNKNDPVGMLSHIMQNMNTNPNPQPGAQQQQFQTAAVGGGMGMGGGMGGGMNPFMTGNPMGGNPMAAGGGMGNPFMAQQNNVYQNPNHNKNPHASDFGGMEEKKGPSMDSWAKDVNDFGFNVKLDVKKDDPTKNDNIKEFQDLFDLGSMSIKQKADNKRGGIDLSYNPAAIPSQAQQQQQMPTAEPQVMPVQAPPVQQQPMAMPMAAQPMPAAQEAPVIAMAAQSDNASTVMNAAAGAGASEQHELSLFSDAPTVNNASVGGNIDQAPAASSGDDFMAMFGGANNAPAANTGAAANDNADDLFNNFLDSNPAPPDLSQAQGHVDAGGLEQYAGFSTHNTQVNSSSEQPPAASEEDLSKFF